MDKEIVVYRCLLQNAIRQHKTHKLELTKDLVEKYKTELQELEFQKRINEFERKLKGENENGND